MIGSDLLAHANAKISSSVVENLWKPHFVPIFVCFLCVATGYRALHMMSAKWLCSLEARVMDLPNIRWGAMWAYFFGRTDSLRCCCDDPQCRACSTLSALVLQ